MLSMPQFLSMILLSTTLIAIGLVGLAGLAAAAPSKRPAVKLKVRRRR